MLKVLKDRFLALGRGEEGVAMVVTLGIFMFLYVTCASVYAIGWAVKEKMHLQAACDAAAYSAAVVQADTFSRIATINRAMSWTYQQMTKRQMDYIVWQWLEEVVEHHRQDRLDADSFARKENARLNGGVSCQSAGPKCYQRTGEGGRGFDIGDTGDRDVWLNGRGPYSESQILSWCRSDFPSHLRRCRESFYSRRATLDDLGNQIDDDLLNIYRMSEVVDRLAKELPTHVDESARAILQANIPAYMTQDDCQYLIRQEQAPRTAYFKPFSNTRHDELIFLSYDDNEVKDYRDDPVTGELGVFGAGIDTWFVRGEGRPQDGAEGIHRSFNHSLSADQNPLRATWTWWATGWMCKTIQGVHAAVPCTWADTRDCTHTVAHVGHGGDWHCYCRRTGASAKPTGMADPRYERWGSSPNGERRFLGFSSTSGHVACRPVGAQCFADSTAHDSQLVYDNPDVGRYDNRFRSRLRIHEGGRLVEKAIYARPLKLTARYFGPEGTITVGLARRSENPWSALLGHVSGGLYSAFSPVTNSWSFCFASAKAGYKLYHEPDDWKINSFIDSKDWEWVGDAEEKLNGRVRVENGPRDYCIDWKPELSQYMGWYYETDDSGRRIRVNVWSDISKVWLEPTWRQSWNLVQDDWDAVMVPVRQGGSSALEVDNWTADEWETYKHGLSRGNYNHLKDAFGVRHEPRWQNADGNYLQGLADSSGWIPLSGRGAPDAKVLSGTASTGNSAWNIGSPGSRLDWSRIGDEMYH